MATLSLRPTGDGTNKKDTFLYDGATTTNYGTNAVVQVGRDGAAAIAHGLIQFDMSALPASATVTTVVLSLKTNAGAVTSYTNQVYRVLAANSAWTEAGATWAKKDGTNNWAGSVGASTSGTDFSSTLMAFGVVSATSTIYDFTLDLTEFEAMRTANHGVFLKSSDETVLGTAQFYSADDATAGNRPLLTVTYTTPGGGAFLLNFI